MTDELTRPQVSKRDHRDLSAALVRWLSGSRPGSTARVENLTTPQNTGMSSDTILFDAVWPATPGGVTTTDRLVVRLAPDPDSAPLFPAYDLERQYRVMEAVAARSAVPVPPLRGYESDPSVLGSAFIVMERVDGDVPPDIPPYVFGEGWIADASPAQRDRMARGSVEVLAALHAIPDAEATFPWLAPPHGESALRAHVDEQKAYAAWVLDGRRGALIERGFAWLDDHWPGAEGPTVLSWGDARIGNIIFRDFTPVAVLDWEMASLAPRELDLAWMIYLHRFFDDLALEYGYAGLPTFLTRSSVISAYESITGHTPSDLDWYTTYAAVRHAIIMTRVGLRAVHFGEAEMPDDIDALVTHGASLEAMLARTYWDQVPA